MESMLEIISLILYWLAYNMQVYSNRQAFAAVTIEGSLMTWGDSGCGGNCRDVAQQLTEGIASVHCTNSAFAALKRDGSVVTWGLKEGGGCSDDVKEDLASAHGDS